MRLQQANTPTISWNLPAMIKRNRCVLLGAKILAVADAFDAMTTDRPYQKGMSPETALGIVKKHAGKKSNKKCVAAFESVIN